mmetsp:Transcript_6738/g.12002  ORF Transcript_6738/g.12002 Transcript_6738/m.12002 type:complete len:359 (+) Transcript_6738:264-1340(+)
MDQTIAIVSRIGRGRHGGGGFGGVVEGRECTQVCQWLAVHVGVDIGGYTRKSTKECGWGTQRSGTDMHQGRIRLCRLGRSGAVPHGMGGIRATARELGRGIEPGTTRHFRQKVFQSRPRTLPKSATVEFIIRPGGIAGHRPNHQGRVRSRAGIEGGHALPCIELRGLFEGSKVLRGVVRGVRTRHGSISISARGRHLAVEELPDELFGAVRGLQDSKGQGVVRSVFGGLSPRGISRVFPAVWGLRGDPRPHQTCPGGVRTHVRLRPPLRKVRGVPSLHRQGHPLPRHRLRPPHLRIGHFIVGRRPGVSYLPRIRQDGDRAAREGPRPHRAGIRGPARRSPPRSRLLEGVARVRDLPRE